jgi:hypothetical protein
MYSYCMNLLLLIMISNNNNNNNNHRWLCCSLVHIANIILYYNLSIVCCASPVVLLLTGFSFLSTCDFNCPHPASMSIPASTKHQHVIIIIVSNIWLDQQDKIRSHQGFFSPRLILAVAVIPYERYMPNHTTSRTIIISTIG